MYSLVLTKAKYQSDLLKISTYTCYFKYMHSYQNIQSSAILLDIFSAVFYWCPFIEFPFLQTEFFFYASQVLLSV